MALPARVPAATGPRRRAGAVAVACAAGPLLVLAGLHLGPDPRHLRHPDPALHKEAGYASSASCLPCHPDQHASWARTFHSTMTQRATSGTVLGIFDGRRLSFYGREARVFRRGGRYFMDLPEEGGRREAEVVLTVGSRRYQQYFEREQRDGGAALVRLPLLWHIEEREWLHMNSIFLAPDDPDWGRHRATWNENCIFCHNTGPRPRMDHRAALAGEKVFASDLADLGIACEACHGPGEAHGRRFRHPFRRLAAALGDAPAGDIVHPQRLPKQEAVDVCGQCHGQRLPEPLHRIRDFLEEGPTFRPGGRLTDHVAPITCETPPLDGADQDLFRARFWGDGTPRLTAYEYQGLLDSPCHARGPLTCGSCHVMHGGDVRGQIEPPMRGNAACTGCHEDIARALEAHTMHPADSSGSQCMDCHMPRIVYGILTIHRSHRIENPDAARDTEAGRPNACTLCHLDRSPLWAADEMARLWGPHHRRPASRPDGAPLDLADAVASLLSGDAVQRAVYAHAAGRPEAALDPARKAFLRLALAATAGDAWPAVRRIARRSLLALEAERPLGLSGLLEGMDVMAPPQERREAAGRLLAALRQRSPGRLDPPGEPPFGPDFSPDVPALLDLLERQSGRTISIGE